MNIQQLLDLARVGARVSSDRALAQRINLRSIGNISYWRSGKGLPSEDYVIKLCELAAIKPELGLIHLNIWRTEGGARTTYIRALKMLEDQVRGDTRPSVAAE